MLDFPNYLHDLIRRNRLAGREGFHPCTCSGLGYLEDMLAGMRDHRAFACVSDVCEESTMRRSGAWFKRRVFTVFLVRRYDTREMAAYREALDLCRQLFRQLHSRFIVDEARLGSQLIYLDTANMPSRELGGQFLNGFTGLYFMLAIDEPIDLQYRPDEWDEDGEAS